MTAAYARKRDEEDDDEEGLDGDSRVRLQARKKEKKITRQYR